MTRASAWCAVVLASSAACTGKPDRKPRAAVQPPPAAVEKIAAVVERGSPSRDARVAVADPLEVGDAPPDNDPWDALTSQQRVEQLDAELQDVMAELRRAKTPEAFADAQSRAAMALTSMRPELVATPEGQASYAQRRAALTAIVAPPTAANEALTTDFDAAMRTLRSAKTHVGLLAAQADAAAALAAMRIDLTGTDLGRTELAQKQAALSSALEARRAELVPDRKRGGVDQ